MPLYESVFIARQDIAVPQVEAITEAFKKIITDDNGSVPKDEYWGLRSIAYRIKKNRKGHYVLMNIDAPSSAIMEMERQMRINEDVLRYMTIRVDELEEGPSVVMRNRNGGSEDRPRRAPRGEDEGNAESAPAPTPAPVVAAEEAAEVEGEAV